MPKVTVYVRKEDYPAWRSIEAKTTFIHNALNKLEVGGIDSIGMLVDDRTSTRESSPPKVITQKVKYCKHGNPLGQCLDKAADRSCRL